MREKQLKCILTFHNTTSAIAMEKICRAEGVKGRLIPLPSEISAGCGLAWASDPEEREALLALVERHQVEIEQHCELMI